MIILLLLSASCSWGIKRSLPSSFHRMFLDLCFLAAVGSFTGACDLGFPWGLKGTKVSPQPGLKPVLNILQSLGKVALPTSPKHRQGFCSSKYFASHVVWSLGEVAKADHWLASQFISCGWVGSHCLLWGVSTCGQWKMKLQPLRIKKLNSFYFPSWSIMGCCGTHLSTVAKTELKEVMCFCGKSLKIWAQIPCCSHIKNWSNWRHLCQVREARLRMALRRGEQSVIHCSQPLSPMHNILTTQTVKLLMTWSLV